jgi:hypothetical protein
MTIPWMPFRWVGDELGGRYFDKAAMFVMADLPEVGLSGLFQFDLGVPISVLYEQNVGDVLNILRARQDPDRHFTLMGVDHPVIHTPLTMGQARIPHVGLLKDFGGGEADVTGDRIRLLGTVGADIVEGKCLIIDFPRERLAIMDEAPAAFAEKAIFTAMERSPSGHILVELAVDGAPKRIQFDTGSSIFEFLTDREIWAQVTRGEVTDSMSVPMWGHMQEVLGGVVQAEFRLGDMPLNVRMAYYIDREELLQFNRAHHLFGAMGNAPFLDHTILLDFSQARFGVISQSV